MNAFLSKVNIQVDKSTFIKDPDSSALGKNMVRGSIELICKIGFDEFTFKKLAEKINSTERSIYRYFESKHKVLLYLTNWYWSWMEYRLMYSITNIESPYERLERSINLLTERVVEDGNFEYINEGLLNKIVLSESLKAFLIKEIVLKNKDGAFMPYKLLVHQLADIILEINPDYKYPHMLISTVIEGAHLQRHFAQYIPLLTDKVKGEDAVAEFYNQLIFKAIK